MAGIYIHIPFCAKQCTYCDFHFSTSFASYKDRMIAALATELAMRAPAWSTEPVETVYFGGGTPSLLSGTEIGSLLEAIRSHYATQQDMEITLECNPDDCSEANLLDWKAVGVNRLSIGIQSFTDDQLAWMNRTHSAHEGLEAVKRAKATGFSALTVDLMYGLPGLSPDQWSAQLQQVIALDVDHISAYCLTIEERTPLAKWVQSGKIHPSTADQQSEQFELLVATLAEAGFEQYEISNFARNERYSQHNTAYWLGKKYVAIGPSAHGFDGTDRYWNVANNHQYMQQIKAGTLPETVEVLTLNDRFNELLLIGLRTKWGVSKTELEACLSPGLAWQQQIDHWKASGNMVETDTHYLLTQEGRLLADAIASDLFVLNDN
jgi:oxygen-independent coproporphyrinogen-3 oxidase